MHMQGNFQFDTNKCQAAANKPKTSAKQTKNKCKMVTKQMQEHAEWLRNKRRINVNKCKMVTKQKIGLREANPTLKVLAEDTGFEPAEAFTSTVFKTAALNRSANPPNRNHYTLFFPLLQVYFEHFFHFFAKFSRLFPTFCTIFLSFH